MGKSIKHTKNKHSIFYFIFAIDFLSIYGIGRGRGQILIGTYFKSINSAHCHQTWWL